MAFRKFKKCIQMWRLARRHETQHVSYSLQTLVFRGREPAAKEIRRLHWRLLAVVRPFSKEDLLRALILLCRLGMHK